MHFQFEKTHHMASKMNEKRHIPRSIIEFQNTRKKILKAFRDQGVGDHNKEQLIELRMAMDSTATLKVRKHWSNAVKIPKSIIPNLKLYTQPSYQSSTMTE